MGFRNSLLLLAAIVLGAGLAAGAQAQSSPSAFTTGYRYDAERRLVGTIEPDPDGVGPLHYAATRNTYDAAGRLTKVEKGELASWQPETVAPASWTGFTVLQQVDTTYDALDRKILEKESSGGTTYTVTQTSYDLAGRVDCVAVRMNPETWSSLPRACASTTGSNGTDRITHNVYDAAGQLLKVQKAYNSALQQDYATYTYNNNGKLTSVTDADGNLATMAYDGQDRQANWVFPSPTTHGATNAADYEAYGYDQNGNRTSLRKRDTTTITYRYDALNRVIVKTVPTSATGAAGYSVYQGYDNRGLLLYARFGSATGVGITNAYDNVGRLTSSSTNMDGFARTFTSTYDADGNRTQLQGDQGYAATFDYDGLDRMSGVHDSAGTMLASFTYDPLGRRGGLGQGYGASYSTTSYAYDGASRLQTMTHDLAGTASDQVLGFGYNPASQIVQRTRSNSGWEFTEQVQGSKSYAVNGLNQYTSAAGVGFGYDANGNLSSDGTNTYVYDAENRLVSVGPAGQQPTVALSYDPLGRLWQYAAPTGSGTVRFLYDGDRLTQEENSGGAQMRAYAHGPDADEPLVWYEYTGGGVRHYLHADHQGSIVAVADDAGNMLAIDKYDEWGVPASGNASIGTIPQRFQYTGQVWLPDLGLYYYKARIYSSRLGRFLQTDPIGYKDQVNLYAYVGNDPIDGRDPDGQVAQAVAAPVVCAGPQAPACAAVGAALACAASSGCRHGVDSFLHSRVGAAVMCAAGNCTYLGQRLLSEIRTPQKDKPGTAGGERAGRGFTRKGKREVIEERARETGGNPRCVDCDENTNDAKRTQKGDMRDPRERNVDHIIDRANNGDGSPSNGALRCFECNLKKPPRSPNDPI